MRPWLQSIAGMLLLVLAQATSAAGYSVQFAGTFGPYCLGSNCAVDAVSTLAGTAFSGEFLFPEAGIDLVPGDPGLGIYAFSDAVGRFRFDSAIEAFDVADPVAMILRVHNCIGEDCAPGNDLVSLSAEVAGYSFDLSLVNIGPVTDLLTSDAIPAIDILQSLAMHSLFGVSRSDYTADVPGYWNGPGSVVTSAVAVVPAPASAWLLGTGLALLARRRVTPAG